MLCRHVTVKFVVLTVGTGVAGIQGWASAATPSTAVVDPNVGAHLAFVPQGFASLCPETPCILSGNDY